MKKSIKTPSAKEFNELKSAYDDMRNAAVARMHEAYNLSVVTEQVKQEHVRLRAVIFKYELFTITVIALTFIHVALVAIHS